MIKEFLKQKGYSYNDIVVWEGIITRLNVINQFVKEPDDIRFADTEEIKRYLDGQ
jgi:hypothetical protein